MNQDENLDLLDLENDTGVDALPEAAPFTAPRPKKPWLLMGLGFAIIVLATWIIIARVGGDSGTSVSVDLDTPVVVNDAQPQNVPDLNVPAKPVEVAPVAAEPKVEPAPKPEVKPVVEENGNPVRVIEDRKEVVFNPDKAEIKPEPKPEVKPVAKKPATQKISAPKKATKPQISASNGSIYVQFGSYSTRALAQSAEQKIRNAHQNLFSGKQFVILAAEVKGQTTYRLRVAFQNATDANGFCRNAKSDGLDCYVTK